MNQTTLHAEHKALGAKMVDFADWSMPVSYKGIIEEHNAVRQRAGLFDVSHMGIIDVEGTQSLQYLQYLTVNDVSRLEPFQSQYTMMLDEKGRVLDDMIITRLGARYRLVVNCSNKDKIIAWMQLHKNNFSVHLTIHDDLNILALQGPAAKSMLEPLLDTLWVGGSFNVMYAKLAGVDVLVSRTGYTGEFGYEVFVHDDDVVKLWRLFIEKGAAPVGLGARDTLRIEAGLPLYGHEIYGLVTPFDLGYGWIVKLDKGDFIGKAFLSRSSHTRKLFGIVLEEKVIPRQGTEVLHYGVVTSGTFSPSLGKSIAMFMTQRDIPNDRHVSVKVRDKAYDATIIKLPFIKKGINKDATV